MAWLEISIDVAESRHEAVEQALLDLGAAAVTLAAADGEEIFEPEVGQTPLWSSLRLSALFSADTDPHWIEARLNLGQADAHFSHRILADQDWERAWLADFKPMQFGDRLWVCPSHCSIPEQAGVVVQLDPGLAFGTGTHQTTALCLTWLDQIAEHLAGKVVIDFGCGTGILAIAALKLGASRAIAIDNDPQALEATLENARRNQVADRLTVSDKAEHSAASVLIANILAGPLMELCPTIANLTKAGGHLALSGILSEQADAVADRYRQYFDDLNIASADEWVRITGQRQH